MTKRKKLVSPWTDAEDEIIRSMAAENKSVILVAAKLGTAAQSVSGRGRKLGVKFESNNARRKRLEIADPGVRA